jgi:hypothetical protein
MANSEWRMAKGERNIGKIICHLDRIRRIGGERSFLHYGLYELYKPYKLLYALELPIKVEVV